MPGVRLRIRLGLLAFVPLISSLTSYSPRSSRLVSSQGRIHHLSHQIVHFAMVSRVTELIVSAYASAQKQPFNLSQLQPDSSFRLLSRRE